MQQITNAILTALQHVPLSTQESTTPHQSTPMNSTISDASVVLSSSEVDNPSLSLSTCSGSTSTLTCIPSDTPMKTMLTRTSYTVVMCAGLVTHISTRSVLFSTRRSTIRIVPLVFQVMHSTVTTLTTKRHWKLANGRIIMSTSLSSTGTQYQVAQRLSSTVLRAAIIAKFHATTPDIY